MTSKSRKGKPLKKADEKLTQRLRVNLTPGELRQVMVDFDPLTYPTKAAYFRARMVDQSITKRVVHANLEALEKALVDSNEELNRIGVNINQIAKHLNTYKSVALKDEVLMLIKYFVSAQKTMDKMQNTIHEIHEKW